MYVRWIQNATSERAEPLPKYQNLVNTIVHTSEYIRKSF
jgi:hypothetical protein